MLTSLFAGFLLGQVPHHSVRSLETQLEFERAMNGVNPGMNRGQVLAQIGRPDRIDKRGILSDFFVKVGYSITFPDHESQVEVWSYGANNRYHFPTRGSVVLDKNGVVTDCSGRYPAAAWDSDEASLLSICHDLDSAPTQSGDDDPCAIIRIGNHLIRMGKRKALAAIHQYIRSTCGAAFGPCEGIDLVLATIFIPPQGGCLPSGACNTPLVWPPTNKALAPSYPIVLVYGIPVNVGGYDTTIWANPLSQNLNWFAAHGVLESKPLRPPDNPLKSLDDLPREYPQLMGTVNPTHAPSHGSIQYIRYDPLDGPTLRAALQEAVMQMVWPLWHGGEKKQIWNQTDDWPATKAWLLNHRLYWDGRLERYQLAGHSSKT